LRRFRTHNVVEVAKLNAGTEVRVAGMVVELIPKLVSKGRNQGNRWAIVRVEDFTGTLKCILWSDQYQRFKDEVAADAILLFEGKVEWREGSGEPDLIVERVLTLDQAKSELTRGVVLRMPYADDEDTVRKLDGVRSALEKSKGPCPVYLSVRDAAGKAASFKLGLQVNPMALRVEELEMLLGPGSVLFTGR
jgi:DNA polymerase III subunit alpha